MRIVIGIISIALGCLAIRGFDWLVFSISIGVILLAAGFALLFSGGGNIKRDRGGWWGGSSTDDFDDL